VTTHRALAAAGPAPSGPSSAASPAAPRALEELRQKELINAIKHFDVPHSAIQRAFEKDGCTCAVLREELEGLEEEKHAKENAVDIEYEPRIAELRARVRAIDDAEHPDLDREAHRASPFFRTWLIDRVLEAGPAVLHESDLAKDFVRAWRGGWRP